ncbi:hypothetical protein GMSM_40880 [Geomonas sp. Red276]
MHAQTLVLVLVMVLMAGKCFADDPLESLNTVQDTVSTMEQTLRTRGGDTRSAQLLHGYGGEGGVQSEERSGNGEETPVKGEERSDDAADGALASPSPSGEER